MEKRIISITGTSFLNVKTDFVRISFNVKVINRLYESALAFLSVKVSNIVDIIIKNGFLKEDLKTSNFKIKRETKYNDYKKEYVFAGYSASEDLNISFEIDNKKINDILNDIYKTINDVDFNISFFCSDPSKYENQLIELAVSDAKEKAELITKAAGVKLLQIVNIDYSFSQIHIESSFDYDLAPRAYCSEESEIKMPDMDPEDTQLKKTINIQWEIE